MCVVVENMDWGMYNCATRPPGSPAMWMSVKRSFFLRAGLCFERGEEERERERASEREPVDVAFKKKVHRYTSPWVHPVLSVSLWTLPCRLAVVDARR